MKHAMSVFFSINHNFEEDAAHSRRPRELLRIVAIRVDLQDLSICAKLDITCKPQVHPRLTKKTKEYTNITQQQIELHGIDILTAIKKFCKFCQHAAHVIYYTNTTRSVLDENIRTLRVVSNSYLNVRQKMTSFKQCLQNVIGKKIQCPPKASELHQADQRLGSFVCNSCKSTYPGDPMWRVYNCVLVLRWYTLAERTKRLSHSRLKKHMIFRNDPAYTPDITDIQELQTCPPPPYYAVISTSLHARTPLQQKQYDTLLREMETLVGTIPDFITYESATQTVCDKRYPVLKKTIATTYFKTELGIDRWREMSRHQAAKREGKRNLYVSHNIRICHCTEDYGTNLSQKQGVRKLAYNTRRKVAHVHA